MRLEPKTMATLDSIADEIGYSRNELMQSMVKFGLTNRDWRNEGLTAHKRLPRYQENPDMATKPPSAAQLAARARFAEMARNGSLNRKRQIAAKKNAGVKRKANPLSETPEIILQQLGGNKFVAMTGASEFIAGRDFLGFKIPKNASPANRVTVKYSTAIGLYTIDFIKASRNGLDTKIVESYKDVSADQLADIFTSFTGMDTTLGTSGRKRNPAKKTVSQKISQLVHEGYPQRQAVAVALNEQRAGKVKRNPAGMVKGYAVVCMHPNPHTVAITTSMAEAKKIGQDYASRENVQVAIKPVDVHAAHFA